MAVGSEDGRVALGAGIEEKENFPSLNAVLVVQVGTLSFSHPSFGVTVLFVYFMYLLCSSR